MGSISVPDFANMALAVDEYKFVKEQFRLKRYDILHKLNFLCRYLDNIAAPNFPDFGDCQIYLQSLTLNKSNDDSFTDIAFLDLSISIMNTKFEIKVYCKTDDYQFQVITLPFLESNMSRDMCYYVYVG